MLSGAILNELTRFFILFFFNLSIFVFGVCSYDNKFDDMKSFANRSSFMIKWGFLFILSLMKIICAEKDNFPKIFISTLFKIKVCNHKNLIY